MKPSATHSPSCTTYLPTCNPTTPIAIYDDGNYKFDYDNVALYNIEGQID
jgi:hypothetical protein